MEREAQSSVFGLGSANAFIYNTPKQSKEPPVPDATADKMETDRRAVAAVMKAERELGRRPEQQEHSNPGFDVMSLDPLAGIHYLIEVKGHLPGTDQISVSKTQVWQAQCSPDMWRLAVTTRDVVPIGMGWG